MRCSAILIAVFGTSAVAYAQSRADQVPATHPDISLPTAPAPTDETTDQPAKPQPSADVISPPPQPATRLVLGDKDSDTLSKHWMLRLGAAYAKDFGSLDSNTSLSTLSGGYALSVSAGYGLSRHVALELIGALASFESATECDSCNARSYGLTAALSYHLVQGVRFDPWVRAGIGASSFHVSDSNGNRDYLGFQWLSAAIGGDWYATRHFGFGPMLSIALTSYFDHPRESNTSLAAQTLIGLNLTVDGSGK